MKQEIENGGAASLTWFDKTGKWTSKPTHEMQFLSQYVCESTLSLMRSCANSETFGLGCMQAVAQISVYLGKQSSLTWSLQVEIQKLPTENLSFTSGITGLYLEPLNFCRSFLNINQRQLTLSPHTCSKLSLLEPQGFLFISEAVWFSSLLNCQYLKDQFCVIKMRCD